MEWISVIAAMFLMFGVFVGLILAAVLLAFFDKAYTKVYKAFGDFWLLAMMIPLLNIVIFLDGVIDEK